MGVPPSQGKLLYHITHINNLPSILTHGLMPRHSLLEQGISNFTDIADPDIIKKREGWQTPLSQYVLFHFFPRNPFDFSVCRKYGADNMVIITIPRATYKSNSFYIIPSHPLDNECPDIYPYEQGYDLIKWEILDRIENRNYIDPKIKKACMAECLIPYPVPPRAFSYIYVNNSELKMQISKMSCSCSLSVEVRPGMFPQLPSEAQKDMLYWG